LKKLTDQTANSKSKPKRKAKKKALKEKKKQAKKQAKKPRVTLKNQRTRQKKRLAR
jgi:hypothetical protein